MGMYTEIVVKARIRGDIGAIEKAALLFLFKREAEPEALPDHMFFTKPRWQMIGACSSYYHHPETVNSFVENGTYLFSRSDIKNYDGEIEAFFDWLKPLMGAHEGQCIGYSWYEESDTPTLILK